MVLSGENDSPVFRIQMNQSMVFLFLNTIVLNIEDLEFGICLVLGASDFEFARLPYSEFYCRA